MLKQSLIAKTKPQALNENVVFWNDYRATILSARLFRLEKNAEKKFRDSATQTVWFRNMPQQAFKVKFLNDKCIIDTGSVTLILKKERSDCRIKINGKILPIINYKNLGGTYRTLDRCNGDDYMEDYVHPSSKVDLSNGVCSRSGIAVFDDAKSLSLADNGEIINEKGLGSDEYIFAYGDDYRSAIKALYAICGPTPFIPRFALGNWWSRYHVYTDKEYLTLLTKFEEKEVPLTVATIDMDWHYSKNIDEEFNIKANGKNTKFYGFDDNSEYGYGWTGYSWNKHLFPDYKSFLNKIEKMNLKITLNLHPADGIRFTEDMYEEMALAMGIDPKTLEQVKFDFTSDRFINNYFDILHKPYEKDGVEFWWLDWQQGTTSNVAGLDPLWALNHYHYLDNAENHSNPLILSRYSGIGSHRYPLGFSGDTSISWKTLKYLPYFTATASNVGYTWWSHDIGGHHNGDKSNEMFLRHVQFGVFSPINRMHSTNNPTLTKEPWFYDNGTGALIERFLRLRHALIPFLYTCSYNTSKEGKALVEPLYYEWKDKNAYKYKEEYLFGGLIVAPIVKPISKKSGFASVKMWIPEGHWTDIFTGDYYDTPKGGKEVKAYRTLESIPVLARAGTILPLSMDKGNSTKNPKKLNVKVYQGNGEYTLYEDGREFNNTNQVFTLFKAKQSNRGEQKLTISANGDCRLIPNNRILRISFEDISSGEVLLYKDGANVDVDALYTDCVSVEFVFDPNSTYIVQVNYKPQSQLERLIDRARIILTHAEGYTGDKGASLAKIKSIKEIGEYRDVVNSCNISSVVKARLLENI